MTSVELIAKYLLFEEAGLRSIETVDLSTTKLTIAISEWNFTSDFFSEWNISIDHEEARMALGQFFPGNLLVIFCKNAALLTMNRVEGHGDASMLLVSKRPSNSIESQSESRTIFSFGFLENSALKDKLLMEYSDRFLHLLIDTVHLKLDGICQELEIENWPIKERSC